MNNTETTPIPSKVVLEASASDALIYMALKEGLLFWDQRHDDGMGRRFLEKSERIPREVGRQVLEQLVFFEQVYLTGHDGRHLSGPLLEERRIIMGDVASTAKWDVSDDPPIASAPEEMLRGLLEAHSVYPNPIRDRSILQEVQMARRAECEWEKKYDEKAPSQFDIVVSEALSHQTQFKRGPMQVEPRYQELEQIRKGYDRFRPTIPALESLFRAIRHAEDRCAYLMVPRDELISDEKILLDEEDSHSPTALLRFVSSNDKGFPRLLTLSDALKVSKRQAAQDLRQDIIEWTDALLQDRSSAIERIEKNIQRRNQALEVSGSGSKVSGAMTYLSLPVTMLSFLPGISALMSSVGIVVTVVGSMGQVVADGSKNFSKWLSYGSVKLKK